MTSTTAADMAEAFADHRSSFGVPISFGSTAIVAIVAESEFGRELAAGGFSETGDLNCKLLLSDLTSNPAIGALVTYNARTFRVSSFSVQPGSLIGECVLRPAKR